MSTTPRPGATMPAAPLTVRAGVAAPRSDYVITEEPLEIRVLFRGQEHVVSVTMRTPGNDFELAVGFLHSEGFLRRRDEVREVSYCASGPPEQLYNIVTVELTDGAPFDPTRLTRHFAATSACGVCGKASLEDVQARERPALPPGPVIDASMVGRLPERLRRAQKLFERTGGVHAAGLFDDTGTLLVSREDVGRHNAVDKVIGSLLLAGDLPVGERVLQVSGRASFEIVQKALAAGIPFISAVSAPSSLAVSLAQEAGMTLVGFVRGDEFNVYAVSDRIRLARSKSSGVSTSESGSGSPSS